MNDKIGKHKYANSFNKISCTRSIIYQASAAQTILRLDKLDFHIKIQQVCKVIPLWKLHAC